MARIPASIRNLNPGAMYPGPSSRKFGATKYETLRSKDGVHKIATFASSVDGAAALFDLLGSKAYTGRTIQEAITKWCGGFYVSTYIKVLEANAGVTRHTRLTRELLANREVAIPLAMAMALQEAGQEYPMTDEEWEEAHARVFGTVAPAPLPVPKPSQEEDFAPDNDIPSPKPVIRVEQAAKGSKTVMGGLLAFLGLLVQWMQEAASALMEAASQATEWTPIAGLAATLGANVASVGFGLGVAGVVLVVTRRLQAAAEGKQG